VGRTVEPEFILEELESSCRLGRSIGRIWVVQSRVESVALGEAVAIVFVF
jgi:hypothetical protein